MTKNGKFDLKPKLSSSCQPNPGQGQQLNDKLSVKLNIFASLDTQSFLLHLIASSHDSGLGPSPFQSSLLSPLHVSPLKENVVLNIIQKRYSCMLSQYQFLALNVINLIGLDDQARTINRFTPVFLFCCSIIAHHCI